MRVSFRVLWFRIELLPRFRVVLDARRRLG